MGLSIMDGQQIKKGSVGSNGIYRFVSLRIDIIVWHYILPTDYNEETIAFWLGWCSNEWFPSFLCYFRCVSEDLLTLITQFYNSN